MQEIIFVMGIAHSGKSTYIKNNFNSDEYVILDILDYQKRLWEDWEYPTINKVMQSYLDLLDDIKVHLDKGTEKIIIEHTLLRACRREMYLDLVKGYNIVKKIVCIMVKKEDYHDFGYDENMEVLEYPIVDEGWDKINIIWR